MPGGRDEALALALVPEEGAGEVPELGPGDVVDPTVVFPDGPVAVAPLTSRTTLLLTSQHCFMS